MRHRTAGLLTLLFLDTTVAQAQDDSRAEVGPRLLLVTAGGVPTNDMSGYGIQAVFRWRPKWRLGFGLDSMGGDFEVPAEVVDIATTEVLDSSVEMLVVTAWAERGYGRWFWTAGVGYASPDVDDLAGPTSSGGTFDLTTDAGSEIVLSATGGVHWSMGRHLTGEVALRVDHHLADWTVHDRVSGRTGSVDDYTAYGAHAGLAWRF